MLIEGKNLNLIYNDQSHQIKALNNVDIELPERGLHGILGPSGSGKTSLLYALAGLKRVTSGSIQFLGKNLPVSAEKRQKLRKKEMGFVFQFHFLINYLTVLENILVGANPDDEYKLEVCLMLLEKLGLSECKDKFPYQLSGGQRQRVAIARSLANRPRILFVDEPTASLDHKMGKKVMDLLLEFSDEATVLVVTHDVSNLEKASQVFEMWDGKLTQTK